MQFNPPQKWFGPKNFGWGMSPRTWEGWVILLVVAAALIAISTTVFS